MMGPPLCLMTSIPIGTAHPSAAPRATRLRRFGEFLVVGGVTPVLFLVSWLLRQVLGLNTAEFWTGFTFFYAAHLLNDPHFSVTYLLFYRNARERAFSPDRPLGQRLRYLAAGVLAPLAMGAWALWALHTESARMLGWMIQLMFLLVGWHYVKQGFGVLMVLSARRGVRFSNLERRVVLAHCYAGWAYAWASPFEPGRDLVEKGVVYHAMRHPVGLEEVTLALFALSAVGLVVVLVRKRVREGPLPIWTPLTGLLCAVWAWSVFSGADPLVRYAVPALHSLQYLYFVGLLRGNEAKAREGAPHFETSARTRLWVLAGSALALGLFFFDLAPAVLDGFFEPNGGRAPSDPLGPTPWFAALYVFINLHHYFMDAVIWRRDNPETRYLLGASPEPNSS